MIFYKAVCIPALIVVLLLFFGSNPGLAQPRNSKALWVIFVVGQTYNLSRNYDTANQRTEAVIETVRYYTNFYRAFFSNLPSESVPDVKFTINYFNNTSSFINLRTHPAATSTEIIHLNSSFAQTVEEGGTPSEQWEREFRSESCVEPGGRRCLNTGSNYINSYRSTLDFIRRQPADNNRKIVIIYIADGFPCNTQMPCSNPYSENRVERDARIAHIRELGNLRDEYIDIGNTSSISTYLLGLGGMINQPVYRDVWQEQLIRLNDGTVGDQYHWAISSETLYPSLVGLVNRSIELVLPENIRYHEFSRGPLSIPNNASAAFVASGYVGDYGLEISPPQARETWTADNKRDFIRSNITEGIEVWYIASPIHGEWSFNPRSLVQLNRLRNDGIFVAVINNRPNSNIINPLNFDDKTVDLIAIALVIMFFSTYFLEYGALHDSQPRKRLFFAVTSSLVQGLSTEYLGNSDGGYIFLLLLGAFLTSALVGGISIRTYSPRGIKIRGFKKLMIIKIFVFFVVGVILIVIAS